MTLTVLFLPVLGILCWRYDWEVAVYGTEAVLLEQLPAEAIYSTAISLPAEA